MLIIIDMNSNLIVKAIFFSGVVLSNELYIFFELIVVV